MSGRICGRRPARAGGRAVAHEWCVCAPRRDARAECYRDLCAGKPAPPAHMRRQKAHDYTLHMPPTTCRTLTTHNTTANRDTHTRRVPHSQSLSSYKHTDAPRAPAQHTNTPVLLSPSAAAAAAAAATGQLARSGRRRQALADRVWPCELSVVEQSVPAAVTKPVRAA